MSKDFVKFFTSVFGAENVKFGLNFEIGTSGAFCYLAGMEIKAKLLAGVWVLGFIGFVSCVDPSANVKPPLPSAAMAKDSGTPVQTLGRGYSLYLTQCAQCHELMMPKDMRVEEWHTIVPGTSLPSGAAKARRS